MIKFFGIMTAVLAAAVFLSAGGGQVNASGPANVRVVHGIPGQDVGLDAALPVDVLVADAICLLEGFEFGDIAGPVALDPGTYNIKVSLANAADPCSNAPVINADVPFFADEDATVIAQLDAAGSPTASKFVNDAATPARGTSRVIAHHTAAAPTVDISVTRGPFFGLTVPGVSNGDQAAADVRPGRWNVAISPAGTGTPVFGPAPVNLANGEIYLVYAVGSLTNSTFTLLVYTI